ncbi:Metal-binding activator 1 [Spathaspora sp. JA1]|nr:Metal-binding activator 1 [Spathaspora sp. JA1]
MILINDVKYSCMECIRGHRSSSCKHHTRPLLQVRSKGRPNVYANGNPNHRIAVFAEKIAAQEEEEQQQDEDEIQINKCAKNRPVIILKASPKQVIDLASGLIVGPYDESNSQPCTSIKQKQQQAPIINGNSFINSSSCCSQTKSCGCCSSNKKKPINKSKILQSYIKKQIEKQIKSEQPKSGWTFVNEYLPEDDPSTTITLKIKTEENIDNTIQQQPTHTDPQLFDVVSIPSCSLPGTCSCDDNCSCEGCIVHGNSKTSMNEFSRFLAMPDNIGFLTNNSINQGNIVLNGSNITTYPQYTGIAATPTSNQIPNPATPTQTTTTTTTTPPLIVESPNVCNCPPDSCNCTNCETHGIINGYKLDEYFKNHDLNNYQNIFLDHSNEFHDLYGVTKQENDFLYEQLLKPDQRVQPQPQQPAPASTSSCCSNY